MMTMTIGLIVAVVLAVAHAMTSFDLALLSIFLVPVGLATPPWPYQQPQSLSWNAVYPIQQESCQLYHPTAVVTEHCVLFDCCFDTFTLYGASKFAF